jgi:hypothetical protein
MSRSGLGTTSESGPPLRELLDLIWPHSGYGELRCIGGGNSLLSGREIKQFFYHLASEERDSELRGLETFARSYDECGWDCYVGVLSRTEPKGTADACSQFSSVLWADIDSKAFVPLDAISSQNGKGLALKAILDFPVPASVIIDTGHGYHAYWKLRSAEAFADCRRAMEGIAKRLKGDSVYDAARIMRLPGLSNHKGGENLPIRLLRLDATRRYSIRDFDEYVVSVPTQRRWTPDGAKGVWSAWLDELIRNGAPQGERSEACFKVAVALARLGYSDDHICEVFLENVGGIGEKYAKRSQAWWRTWLGKVRAATW